MQATSGIRRTNIRKGGVAPPHATGIYSNPALVQAPSLASLLHTPKDLSVTPQERQRILNELNEKAEKQPELLITRTLVSLYSFKEMKQYSVCEVDNNSHEGYGSVNDSRMGIVGGKDRCGRCMQVDCVGHFGLITFAAPIYNPLFLRIIISILTCVCNTCSRSLLRRS